MLDTFLDRRARRSSKRIILLRSAAAVSLSTSPPSPSFLIHLLLIQNKSWLGSSLSKPAQGELETMLPWRNRI